MLLAKTLTSSTFKLALIAIGTFGVIVSAIFSYVYLSTSSYVRSRSDRAIMTQYLSVQGAYDRSGRDGLIALIQQRVADKDLADNVYVIVDPSTNIIDVYVGRVRRKVDGQQAYPLIHTVRGIGYCLRAPG